MSYSVKSIREKFKAQGIFYTPQELVDFMTSFIPADFKPGTVYDPTCGHGALLRAFPDAVKKYGQDLNDVAVEACQDIVNAEIVCGDTLTEPYFIDKKFDLIMANPPFSVKWEQNHYDWIPKDVPALPPRSKADYAFILHCLHCLSDEGLAIIMDAPGICYRGQSEGKIRRWLIENNYVERVVHIEGGKFEDTQIATVLLILRKNKDTTDIIFQDDKQEKRVTLEDVAANGYSLSVSNYIEPVIERETIDPIATELEVRDLLCSHIEKSIMMSYMIWVYFNGLAIDDLLDKIQKIIDKWREKLRNREET